MIILCILLAPRATPQSHNASLSLTDTGISTVCPLFACRQNRQTTKFPMFYLDSVSFTWTWTCLQIWLWLLCTFKQSWRSVKMVLWNIPFRVKIFRKKKTVFACRPVQLDFVFSPITRISFHITSSCWCTIWTCNSTQLSVLMYRQVNGVSQGHMETNNHLHLHTTQTHGQWRLAC